MAAHTITVQLPKTELGYNGITVEIKRNSKAFGKVKIQKGKIVWIEKDREKGYEVVWDDFEALMKSNGTRQK